MAKETKKDETEKENFIFVDTCVIRGTSNKEVVNLINSLKEKGYTPVIPSWQISELENQFISELIYKPKAMANSFDDLKKLIPQGFDTETKDLAKSFNTLTSKITGTMKEDLEKTLELLKQQKVILTLAEHNYLGINRYEMEIAPYENKDNKDPKSRPYKDRFNDAIFWETLLKSSDDDIPPGSILSIYTKDQVFFQDENPKEVNLLLKTEWELLKKGKLELYQETKIEENNKEQPTPSNKPTPPQFRPSETRFFNDQVSRIPSTYEHKASGYLSRLNYLLNEIKSPIPYELKKRYFEEMNSCYNEIRRYTSDFEKIGMAGGYLDEAEYFITNDLDYLKPY